MSAWADRIAKSKGIITLQERPKPIVQSPFTRAALDRRLVAKEVWIR